MGACLSCLKWAEDDTLNEHTPLLNDGHIFVEQPTTVPSQSDMDKIKREQELSQIVNFTGRTLIDLMSVQRPEAHSGGRSANEYKQIIQNAKSSSIKDSWPKIRHNPTGDLAWLKELAQQADEAIQSEPEIKTTEPLVVNFA